MENIKLAIKILLYCVDNKVTHTYASSEIFGKNSGYVTDVKRRISAKFDNGSISPEKYEEFMSTLDKYEEAIKSTPEPDEQQQEEEEKIPVDTESLRYDQDDKKGEAILDYRGNRQIQTLDELLKVCKADLDIWEVERHVLNKWDVHAKDDVGHLHLAQNFQVKAWLKKNETKFDAKKFKEEFMAEMKSNAPIWNPIEYKFESEKKLLEITIFDLHLGKLAWAGETGEDYDSKIAVNRFMTALRILVERALPFKFERIVFPIGNDFYNSDNLEFTTTAGTQQQDDGRWQKVYKTGRILLTTAIDYLRKFAPVDVIIIPGNHDFQKMFYVGDALEIKYENCKEVTINNGATPRKYYNYGNNLLGYTHGNEERAANLPLLMAQEVPMLWGTTKYREFHLGHFHKKTVKTFRDSIEEFSGVIVRQLSSLSGTDSWHNKKGFVGSIKSGEAFIWDHDYGQIGNIQFNI